MSNADVALTAHLMRRAGFGTTLTELEEYVKKGYENVVEDLVEPERCPPVDEDVLDRYFGGSEAGYRTTWMYRMINSPRPLEEKMALFWHHVFATGVGKNQHMLSSANQIDMFRRVGFQICERFCLSYRKIQR